uniref:Uncharacterized protein n=1 Tax=Oryza punctata TaxID=4537 RepID=A0A0E0L0N4_ORYPU
MKTIARYNSEEIVHSSSSARGKCLQHQVTRSSPTLAMRLIGDTLSEKVLPAIATKRIVVLHWKVSKQSNASDETSASKK